MPRLSLDQKLNDALSEYHRFLQPILLQAMRQALNFNHLPPGIDTSIALFVQGQLRAAGLGLRWEIVGNRPPGLQAARDGAVWLKSEDGWVIDPAPKRMGGLTNFIITRAGDPRYQETYTQKDYTAAQCLLVRAQTVERWGQDFKRSKAADVVHTPRSKPTLS